MLERVAGHLVVEDLARRQQLRRQQGASSSGASRYGLTLFVAVFLAIAAQTSAFAPRRYHLSGSQRRQLAILAASAGGGEKEEKTGEKKRVNIPSDEDLKAVVSSVYSSPTRGEGTILDPNDFPELLSDLPGYEVVEEYRQTGEFVSIFDDPSLANARYRDGNDDNNDPYSIAHSTLRDIHEEYDFSLAFLGDFVTQMGASSPLDIDTPISAYLTGEQIFTLLQALNSLDPSEAGLEYADSLSAQELCEESGMSASKLLAICRSEGFSLPFGLDTVLHVSVVQRIFDVASGGGDESSTGSSEARSLFDDDDIIDADEV